MNMYIVLVTLVGLSIEGTNLDFSAQVSGVYHCFIEWSGRSSALLMRLQAPCLRET